MKAASHVGHRLIDGRRVRWDDARAKAAYEKGLWVRSTLADALEDAAARTPDRVLLVDGDRRVTARVLLEEASALAQAMLHRAPVGSVVSFMLPNWHEAATIYLAATLAGMVTNPILPSLRDHELHFILRDADSRFVFVPSTFRSFDYAAMLGRVVSGLERPPVVVVLRGDAGPHLAYESLLRTPAPATALAAREPDAVRMVMYTSGTTGRPKGVLHTHNSLHALLCQLREHWLVEPGDRFLVPSPISHIGGSIYAFEAPLLLGTTAVLMERWDPDDGARLIDAEACTHMAGATPFLEGLLAAAQRAATRLPSLKVFVCGGASVPPSLVRNAKAALERAVVTRVYGSTEVPVTTVGATRADEAAPAAETDGRPGIAEIRLDGHASAPAGEGEVLARGPQMLVGYLREQDEAAAFDADGYFRTGDLARWVDGRYLKITGRAKDIIIRNGENIATKEIEDLLARHPGIAEIAIVGVPDPRTGERAVAVVVPKGETAPDVASLGTFLAGLGVAKFKIPERVVLWNALPKNDAGKVLKHQIRATLAEDSST
ncbi:MAG TPA: AMP-binding protein [Nevskiaceae bacterium]|nr:AMP-binding protein [Nevskiaceae bacterium]